MRSGIGSAQRVCAWRCWAARHYLAAEWWDLFIARFKEGHCAGHSLWNFANESHPEFDEARSERLGWPVEQIFRDLDAAIGDLVAAAEPEAPRSWYSRRLKWSPTAASIISCRRSSGA